MSRLRAGEWTALAGAAALLVTLFLRWFEVEIPEPQGQGGIRNLVRTFSTGSWGSGWDALGWLIIVIALAAVGCAAWLAIVNAINGPVAQTVAASVLTATAGTLAFVVLALRALVFQPGPNDFVVVALRRLARPPRRPHPRRRRLVGDQGRAHRRSRERLHPARAAPGAAA